MIKKNRIIKPESPTPQLESVSRGELGLESIIGSEDSRTPAPISQYPYKSICRIKAIKNGSISFIGTGWLFGKKTIVTAGHNLYSSQLAGEATRVEVFVEGMGQITDDAEFKVHPKWEDDQNNLEFDIGLIYVDGLESLTTFGVGNFVDERLLNSLVTVSGYPTDRDNGKQQYRHANEIKAVRSRRIYYANDTGKGQSGSPVWMNVDNYPIVVGVHAYEERLTPTDIQESNSATRLTNDILNYLEELKR